MQDLINNRGRLTVSQQLALCSYPVMQDSLELFGRAVAATHCLKGQKTLMPILALDLPDELK